MKNSLLISSWSPYIGQACTTTNIAAIGSYIAITCGLELLLMSGKLTKSTLESAFCEDITDLEALLFEDTGITSLERLACTKQLNSENFTDYTKTLMPKRMDIITGGHTGNNKIRVELINEISYILSCAKQCYDVVFCDLNGGMEDRLSLRILENSDKVIVNLNQNIRLISMFFDNSEIAKILKNKDYFIVLGNYSSESKYTARYIKRLFNFSGEIFTVPRNIDYLDAFNDHKTIDFFFAHYDADKNDLNYEFMNELEKISNKIIGYLKTDVNLIHNPLKNESFFSQIFAMLWK